MLLGTGGISRLFALPNPAVIGYKPEYLGTQACFLFIIAGRCGSLSAGLFDAVRHYLRSAPWYRLPITPIAQDVVEQWSITIPSDGQSEHSIHYLAPNDNPEQMRIYLRQDGSWTEAGTSVYGSYLVFPVSGTTAEIAAVSELSIWWARAILAGLLAAVLLLLVLLFRKIVKRHRKKKVPTAQMQDTGIVILIVVAIDIVNVICTLNLPQDFKGLLHLLQGRAFIRTFS